MLVLTRTIGEEVVIGKDIYCTILGVKGNQVRLGFDAPKALPVHRKEIHDRISIENEGALSMDDDSALDALMISELVADGKSSKHSALATH